MEKAIRNRCLGTVKHGWTLIVWHWVNWRHFLSVRSIFWNSKVAFCNKTTCLLRHRCFNGDLWDISPCCKQCNEHMWNYWQFFICSFLWNNIFIIFVCIILLPSVKLTDLQRLKSSYSELFLHKYFSKILLKFWLFLLTFSKFRSSCFQGTSVSECFQSD